MISSRNTLVYYMINVGSKKAFIMVSYGTFLVLKNTKGLVFV